MTFRVSSPLYRFSFHKFIIKGTLVRIIQRPEWFKNFFPLSFREIYGTLIITFWTTGRFDGFCLFLLTNWVGIFFTVLSLPLPNNLISSLNINFSFPTCWIYQMIYWATFHRISSRCSEFCKKILLLIHVFCMKKKYLQYH